MQAHTSFDSHYPNELHFAKGVLVDLPYPTNDTLLLTRAATEAVERIYQAGYRYSKAEILLVDLRQPGEFTDDRFAVTQSVACTRLMSTLDEINDRYGRGTVRAGSVPRIPYWGMRREMMSQSYTTRVDQLWTVYANSTFVLTEAKWSESAPLVVQPSLLAASPTLASRRLICDFHKGACLAAARNNPVTHRPSRLARYQLLPYDVLFSARG